VSCADYGEDAGVRLNSVIYTVSGPYSFISTPLLDRMWWQVVLTLVLSVAITYCALVCRNLAVSYLLTLFLQRPV